MQANMFKNSSCDLMERDVIVPNHKKHLNTPCLEWTKPICSSRSLSDSVDENTLFAIAFYLKTSIMVLKISNKSTGEEISGQLKECDMMLDSVKEANEMVTYFDGFNYLSNKAHAAKYFIKYESGIIVIRCKNQCYLIVPENETTDYKCRPTFCTHKHLDLNIDKSKVDHWINCNQKEDDFGNTDHLQCHACKCKFHNSPKYSHQNHGNNPTNTSKNAPEMFSLCMDYVCHVHADVPKIKRGTMNGRKLFNCFTSANAKDVDYLNIWNNDDEIMIRFTNYASHKKSKSKRCMVEKEYERHLGWWV